MSDKYIIKNCPCYESEGAFYNCVNERIEGDCQDCTDCVMKKIVELCSFNYTKGNTNLLAKEILKLLDIQEVE